jgi:hypothetical protein
VRGAVVTLLLVSVVGCVEHPIALDSEPYGYKYFERFRDASGRYYDGLRRAREDVAVYIYYIRPIDLDHIDKDRAKAAHIFIERRKAVPPECSSGFRVAGLGGMENGMVAVTIECT